MKKTVLLLLPLLFVLTISIVFVIYIQIVGINVGTVYEIALVDKVVDGDTFDAISLGSIRLADIDAPERGEIGFSEATSFLNSILSDKKVYLSISDTRSYDRLVCLVLVRHDSSYLLNVNLKLVHEDFAEFDDHPNEFNPDTWTLLVYYPLFFEEMNKYKPLLYTVIIATTITIAGIYLRKRRLKLI
jgi:hypothetical protein